jgi:hypothetical protein
VARHATLDPNLRHQHRQVRSGRSKQCSCTFETACETLLTSYLDI